MNINKNTFLIILLFSAIFVSSCNLFSKNDNSPTSSNANTSDTTSSKTEYLETTGNNYQTTNTEDTSGVRPNRSPTVQIILDTTRVISQHQLPYIADASDPEGDDLTYEWNVTAGTLDNTSSRNVTWTTPNYTIDTTIYIIVKVRDIVGNEVSAISGVVYENVD